MRCKQGEYKGHENASTPEHCKQQHCKQQDFSTPGTARTYESGVPSSWFGPLRDVGPLPRSAWDLLSMKLPSRSLLNIFCLCFRFSVSISHSVIVFAVQTSSICLARLPFVTYTNQDCSRIVDQIVEIETSATYVLKKDPRYLHAVSCEVTACDAPEPPDFLVEPGITQTTSLFFEPEDLAGFTTANADFFLKNEVWQHVDMSIRFPHFYDMRVRAKRITETPWTVTTRYC